MTQDGLFSIIGGSVYHTFQVDSVPSEQPVDG